MRILDLRNDAAFEKTCCELAESVLKSGIRYDVVIGIATGGDVVGSVVSRQLGYAYGHRYESVLRQRQGTKAKRRIRSLRPIVRRLPTFAQDTLRLAETAVGELAFLWHRRRRKGKLVIDGNAADAVRGARTAVLVIDDAIDSGNTVVDVIEGLREHGCKCPIHTACVTVTYQNTLWEPTYTLFRRTIVKFPWALDN